jgi:hypothetical protein
MTLPNKFHTISILIIAGLSITLNVRAQKLPNVQKTSLRAPATIKIDGKTTEWNGQLQAYNKSTNIYYTIANDDKNLYLTILATDKDVIKKILGNTFSLTLNKLGDAKKTMSISLPIFEHDDKKALSSALNSQNALSTDSLIAATNLKLEKVKEFGLKGFEGINEETISVYNEYGIKAKALFDNTKALTYELVIPRKYINTASNKLNYTITVYGLGANEKGSVVTIMEGGAVMVMNESAARPTMTLIKDPAGGMLALATTDMSGEYELAK